MWRLQMAERGVSFEFLNGLVSKKQFANVTSREVVETYVLEQTREYNCSLCEIVKHVRPNAIGQATHYVCHSWDSTLGDLLRTLEVIDASWKGEGEHCTSSPFFWIDIFATNLNNPVTSNSSNSDIWLYRDQTISEVKKTISQIRRSVICLNTIAFPSVISRSWVLFECMQTLVYQGELIICPRPHSPDEGDAIAMVVLKSLENFESVRKHYKVDFNESKTFSPIHKEWLSFEIKSLNVLGINWLNEQLDIVFGGWLIDRIDERIYGLLQHDLIQHESSKNEDQLRDRLKMLQSIGLYMLQCDRHEKAKSLLEYALSVCLKWFGEKDLLSLSLRYDYACLIAQHFASFKEAEAILRDVLKLREETLGLDDDVTIETVVSLGRLLKEQRVNVKEAISLFERAVEQRKRTRGVKHLDTLFAMNFLALSLQKNEDYLAAEEVLRNVVHHGIHLFTLKNFDVLVWSNNLAVLLQDMKQLEKAEALFRATLRNSELSLGPNHPQTLTVVFNLAWCLCQQGRFRSAEAFFRRELSGCIATKGPDHKDTVRSRSILVKFLRQQERYSEANRVETGVHTPDEASPQVSAAASSEGEPPVKKKNGYKDSLGRGSSFDAGGSEEAEAEEEAEEEEAEEEEEDVGRNGSIVSFNSSSSFRHNLNQTEQQRASSNASI